jgi:hypothetical protein
MSQCDRLVLHSTITETSKLTIFFTKSFRHKYQLNLMQIPCNTKVMEEKNMKILLLELSGIIFVQMWENSVLTKAGWADDSSS